MGIGIGLGTGLTFSQGVVCSDCHRKVEKDTFNEPKICPFCDNELSIITTSIEIKDTGTGYGKVSLKRTKEFLEPR